MTTKKANPDYTASAERLTNAREVGSALVVLHNYQVELGLAEVAIVNAVPPDLMAKKRELAQLVEGQMVVIKGMIDTFGGYQDTTFGYYALKQRRQSVTYTPELVRQYAPSKVASFVLIEAVDQKAMEAMLKAGQIDAEIAKKCGDVKETFAYIIK